MPLSRRMRPMPKKPRARPGRKPLRVTSGGLSWEELSRKVSAVPKPAEGWPTPEQMTATAEKPKKRRKK